MESSILKLYPAYSKVYGPYVREDGRSVVVLYDPINGRTTRQYAKVLLEVKLGRLLIGDETVDHIDGDFTNDNLDNLRVLSRLENAADSVLRITEQTFNCLWCDGEVKLAGRRLHDAKWARKRGKAGPFCSRRCSGQYGKAIQDGQLTPFEVVEVVPEYHSNKQAH